MTLQLDVKSASANSAVNSFGTDSASASKGQAEVQAEIRAAVTVAGQSPRQFTVPAAQVENRLIPFQ